MEESVKKALIEIVGKENVTDDLIELIPYAYDASDHDHRPDQRSGPSAQNKFLRFLIWPMSIISL